ncbi:MAG TPA: YfhO family protein, partial [Polyangiaceae bacterium]
WAIASLLVLAVGSLLMAMGGYSFVRIFLHLVLPALNFSRLPAVDSRGLFVLALSVLAGGGALLTAQGDGRSSHLARRVAAGLFFFFLVSVIAIPWLYGKALDIATSTLTFEAICMLLALLALNRSKGNRLVAFLIGIAWLETGYCAIANFAPIGQPVSAAEFAGMSRHVSSFTAEGVDAPRLGDGANPLDQSSLEGFIAKKFHLNDYNPLRLWRFNALVEAGFMPWMQSGARVVALPSASNPQNYAAFAPLMRAVQFDIEEFTPNRVRYHVELAEDAKLVFNEVYFPGWSATIDGKQAAVLPLAHGLRSLSVQAGTHEIVFRFKPDSFFVALVTSLIGFIVFAAWLVWLRRHPREAIREEALGAESELFLGARA